MKLKIYERKEIKKIVGGDDISRFHDVLSKIYDEFNPPSSDIRVLGVMIKYNKGVDLYKQYKLYKTLKKTKGNSLLNYTVRYGEEEGLKRYKEKNERCKHTLENHIKRHGDEKGRALHNELIRKKREIRKRYIEKYGEEEGGRRWDRFKDKCSKNFTIESIIRKRGVVEGTERFNRLQEYFSKYGTVQYYIDKHGSEIGPVLFNEARKRRIEGNTLKGFIRRHGIDEGMKRMRKCKDHKSLSYFITKYGEEEGTIKYNLSCERVKFRRTLQYYKNKHGDELGEKKYLEYRHKVMFKNGYSKVSQELFRMIFQQMEETDRLKTYFAEQNTEYFLISAKGNFYYDFVCTSLGKVIEFNGDCFHANPAIYSSTDTPNPYLKTVTSEEIWKKDKTKIDVIAELRGFKLLVVWEKEFRENKESVLDRCLDFLYESN